MFKFPIVMSFAFTSLIGSVVMAAPAAQPVPRLKVDGPRVVDAATSRPVTLRGVNLGNWLLIEPGGVGGSLGGWRDQAALFATLRDRFGEDERRRLIGIYRDSFITTRDFDAVESFGFNLVRVGFDYDLLEDDARPMMLRDDAFKYLDFAVAEARARGIYVLFDLHGAQGRAVDGKQSGRIGPAELWTNPQFQERSLWMWSKIVEHFKGEPAVIGYEALNEPWGKDRPALRDYCARWYARLRPIDGDAVLCFPGWYGDIDFYGKPAESGWTNAMFDMHFYPGSFGNGLPDVETNARFLQDGLPEWAQRMDRLNAPLLIGEINNVYKRSGGGEMMRRYYDFAAEHSMPLTFWTLKELTRLGGVGESMWMLTTNRDALPIVDVKTATKAEIEAAFARLATMPLVTDPDALHWLTTDAKPRTLPHVAPATTRAS